MKYVTPAGGHAPSLISGGVADYPEKTCSIDALVTHKRFVRATLAGEKTQQRRAGVYAYPGETFELEGVAFRTTGLEQQRLGDMSEEDARREGYSDLERYKDLILRMHKGMQWDPDMLAWVHTFERVDATI